MTDTDWQEWHDLMQAHGWKPVRDVFGVVVRYERPRGQAKPLVLEAGDFAMWARLRDTPPPF